MMQKKMVLILVLLVTILGVMTSADLTARDLTRTITADQFSHSMLSQRAWVNHLMSLRANAGPGVSYVNIIPLVYSAQDPGKTLDRTNLGLNNFSQGSIPKNTTDAYVEIYIFDRSGNKIPATSGGTNYITRTVKANQMTQISNIVSWDATASAFNVGTTNPFYGWVLIFSDQPLTAWASIIHSIYSGTTLVVDDPAVELAVADQIYKPAAFMEKTGTRLAILSTLKSARWVSSLSVANVGEGDGNLSVSFYDSSGNEVGTRVTSSIKAHGVYYNADIRNNVPDFGMLIVEVSDANTGDSLSPRIVANSIVRNVQTGDSSFFEAFALPPVTTAGKLTRSMAGYWTGTLTGSNGNVSCNVKIELFQERDQLYGLLMITSGKFPAQGYTIADPQTGNNVPSFLVQGEVNNDTYLLQVQDPFDKNLVMFSLRMWASSIPSGSTTMDQNTAFIYFDENNKGDMGTFTLTWQGDIY